MGFVDATSVAGGGIESHKQGGFPRGHHADDCLSATSDVAAGQRGILVLSLELQCVSLPSMFSFWHRPGAALQVCRSHHVERVAPQLEPIPAAPDYEQDVHWAALPWKEDASDGLPKGRRCPWARERLMCSTCTPPFSRRDQLECSDRQCRFECRRGCMAGASPSVHFQWGRSGLCSALPPSAHSRLLCG